MSGPAGRERASAAAGKASEEVAEHVAEPAGRPAPVAGLAGAPSSEAGVSATEGAPSGGLARLRRWWQPAATTPPEKGIEPRPLPQPVPTAPPRGKKQTAGVRWEEVNKDPRQAYRFVDASDVGWEAVDGQSPFKATDWHKAKEKAQARAAAWWVDGADGSWHQGEPPATLRPALAEERPDLSTARDLHGYATAGDVPVFVKARYRPTKGSRKTKGGRSAGLRALDRAARLLMTPVSEEETPHLATATSGGQMLVAGNTGKRSTAKTTTVQADEVLSGALDESEPLPEGRRARKDALKLRALRSGDYRAHHARDGDLEEVSGALGSPPAWGNVDAWEGHAEHGEMTVLQAVHQDLAAAPNAGPVITKPLGGVKLACGACRLAFEAYNREIAAPLGYRVKVSGTHGGFYNGWQAPPVIRANARALAVVTAGLPKGASLSAEGVLLGVDESGSRYHDPEESDSEWEEVPD